MKICRRFVYLLCSICTFNHPSGQTESNGAIILTQLIITIESLYINLGERGRHDRRRVLWGWWNLQVNRIQVVHTYNGEVI